MARKNLFIEKIKVQLNANEIKSIEHRLGYQPNRIKLKPVGDNNISLVSIESYDKTSIILKNNASFSVALEIILERFHTLTKGAGVSDKTITPTIENDGNHHYEDIEKYLGGTLMANEDPWIRYVDPNGSDNNDGKTPETAWKTLNYAVSQLPAIANMVVLKLAAGTFEESVTIVNAGIKRLIIAGTFQDVYTKAQIANAGNYSRHGNNTPAKWTEIVLTEDPSEPITWDDSLKDYYIEITSSYQNRKYRGKILDYDASAKRLYVDIARGFSTSIGSCPQTVKIVKIATKILASSNPPYTATLNVYAGYNEQSECVDLHALEIVYTGNDNFALRISGKVGFGDVKVYAPNCYTSLYNANNCDLLTTFARSGLPEQIRDIVDPSVYTFTGSIFTTALQNNGLNGFNLRGNVSLLSLYWLGGRSDYNFYIQFTGIMGSIYADCGVRFEIDGSSYLTVYGKFTAGYIRVEANYDANINFSCPLEDGKAAFKGTPHSGYGRIYLVAGTIRVYRGGVDFGDCSTFPGTCPLLTIDRLSNLYVNGSVNIGSSGKEINSSYPLILVKGKGRAVFNGDVTLYHGTDGTKNTPTFQLLENSEVLFTNGADLICNTKTAPTAGKGIIDLRSKSKLILTGSGARIAINQSLGNTAGYDILVDESELINEGTTNITSSLTGISKVCSNGRMRLSGAIAESISSSPLLISGENATLKQGAETVSACKTLSAPFTVSNNAKVTVDGDVKVPTADYGQGGIWEIRDGAEVDWTAIQTDGNPTTNRNSNATIGYGVYLKRKAQLYMVDGNGPDGSTADAYLGVVGATNYPASAGSITDIPSVNPNTTELCSIHRKS